MRHKNEEYIRRIEEYVSDCRLNGGFSPTIADIVSETGISRSTVGRYMVEMEKRGILENHATRRMETRTSAKAAGTVSVPLLGRVSCGPLKDAVEDIEEYLRIPESWCGPGNYFALRANGDSMINVGVNDRDVVIVRQQGYAEPGQIIVALVDNEAASLKRYRPLPDGKTVELVPENETVSVIRVNTEKQRFVIQGVAVKVVKDLI